MSTTKLPTTCTDCGKRTNKVNRSEMNPELCNNCYAKAELEAEHQDDLHEEYVKGCYLCNEERNKAMEANELSDHWINVHARRQPDCTTCDLVAEKDRGEVDPIWYEGPTTAPADQAAIDAMATKAKQAHFDHSACDHPKTAKDRAQCRKTGRAAVFHGVIDQLPAEDDTDADD